MKGYVYIQIELNIQIELTGTLIAFIGDAVKKAIERAHKAANLSGAKTKDAILFVTNATFPMPIISDDHAIALGKWHSLRIPMAAGYKHHPTLYEEFMRSGAREIGTEATTL